MASTIETKINRISDNIAATYAAVEEMGGTVPEAANSDNLPEAVRTIPVSGVVVDDTLTISGAAADAKATGDALAGKEPLHKVLSATLVTGETTLTFTDSAITDNALVYIYTSVWGVMPNTAVQSGGTLTLTFDAQSADIGVKVEVR